QNGKALPIGNDSFWLDLFTQTRDWGLILYEQDWLDRQTDNRLEYGVMGSILTIPANYNHSMIVFYSSEGINEGIRKWGKTMQKAFNRTNKNRLNDLTINYLGYYTDNGAYYYYNTEQGMNYEETMINVHNQIPLPFHYIQL
ncbi:unnamed protein product, partial [Adineta steineri]